ncbi:PhzF family phenazine biosynthesis protein [Ascidiaceihabitans sp.]|uniref:PhzF family phenazine biosynthesis protein n=1 Tax=Ascidiaceihabitans sp. TaxID=1872644 RepID=UPI0032992F13
MSFEFDWVDAFTDQAFGGNGCAVAHGGAGLEDAQCLAYVRETSLVECTFTGPSDIADIRVRYFLASREIPFAGHPTLATVVAMRHRGLIDDGDWVLETQAGLVPVRVDGTHVTMTQVPPVFGQKVPADIVAAVGGLDAQDIVHLPQIVSTGLPFCITVLKSRADVDRVRLNLDGLHRYADFLGRKDVDIMEPFWVAQDGATSDGDTYARLLLAPPSPPEDPFTGSATGAMASYLWAHGLIEAPEFTAQQGHGLGRPGQATVKVLGPRDAITGVEVSGYGYVLMSGKLHL